MLNARDNHRHGVGTEAASPRIPLLCGASTTNMCGMRAGRITSRLERGGQAARGTRGAGAKHARRVRGACATSARIVRYEREEREERVRRVRGACVGGWMTCAEKHGTFGRTDDVRIYDRREDKRQAQRRVGGRRARRTR